MLKQREEITGRGVHRCGLFRVGKTLGLNSSRTADSMSMTPGVVKTVVEIQHGRTTFR
jgi:hypothetical protein